MWSCGGGRIRLMSLVNVHAPVDESTHATCVRDGLFTYRRGRHGPEADLIARFLSRLTVDVPDGCKWMVFSEPQLECGVPDIVIAVWHAATMMAWGPARASIRPRDLRLMQFIVNRPGVSDAQIRTIYSSMAVGALRRLKEANLIHRVAERWFPHPISNCYGLRGLIAIEAKVNHWTRVIEQARRNTWFATQSLALVPAENIARLDGFTLSDGVRLCTDGSAAIRCSVARTHARPKCYVSWAFNEVVWRTQYARATLGNL